MCARASQQICWVLMPYQVNIESPAGFCLHMSVMCRVMGMPVKAQIRAAHEDEADSRTK